MFDVLEHIPDDVVSPISSLWVDEGVEPGGASREADPALAAASEFAQVLKKHPQVWVYADEIYSRLVFQGDFFSIAQVPGMYERTIISDGASKTWAMTGWRIGFTANPVLGLVVGRSASTRNALMPWINFFRSLSPIAWIPFAIIWFGILGR